MRRASGAVGSRRREAANGAERLFLVFAVMVNVQLAGFGGVVMGM